MYSSRFGLTIAFRCGVLLWSLIEVVACAHAEQYDIAVRQIGDHRGKLETISCSDNAKEPCYGHVELSVAGKTISIMMIALLTPGNAYLRFRAREKDLLVGSQAYVHVAIGRGPSETTRVVLAETSPVFRHDAPDSLYRRPVLRYPDMMLATVQIDVRPTQ